nr:hypothetical protein K-LCC10_0310 [Kaumoebavirus]
MSDQLLNLLPPEIVDKIDDHLIENYRRDVGAECARMIRGVTVQRDEGTAVITVDTNVTMYGECPYCNVTLSLKQIKEPMLTIHNHWSPVCEGALLERNQRFFSQPTSYSHMTSWTLDHAKMNEEET